MNFKNRQRKQTSNYHRLIAVRANLNDKIKESNARMLKYSIKVIFHGSRVHTEMSFEVIQGASECWLAGISFQFWKTTRKNSKISCRTDSRSEFVLRCSSIHRHTLFQHFEAFVFHARLFIVHCRNKVLK